MRAIEKLWNVVYTINEAYKITPSNEPCKVSPGAFGKLAKDDIDKILRKLTYDEKVINLIHTPESDRLIEPSDDPDENKYVLGIISGFESFFEDTYRHYHQGIHKLGTKNFLAVHELVLDIEQEIEMADDNEVIVDVLNRTMRFAGLLFPTDSPHFRDAYCDLRIKSADYLKRHGAIKSYEVIDNQGSGWDAKLRIIFNAYMFDGFADKTKHRYKEEFYQKPNNTQVNNKEEQPSSDNAPTDGVPTDGVLSEKVLFDAKASQLKLGSKLCNIPDETLEHYICKLVFKNRRLAAKEDDILEYTAKSQDSQRAVYDAMQRINKKANKQLGTPKLLSYKAAKVRITAEYQ